MATCETLPIKNTDGLTVFTRSWLASDSNYKAVVFISHGITDHSGRHHKLALFLQENQFAVYAHDHVGHGKSDGDRIHIDSFQIYVRDVMQHVELLKAKHPELPVYIIGESMGATIAALTIIENPQLFAGAIFSAPALLNNTGYIKGALLRVIAYLSPQYIIVNDNPHVISTDPAEVQERVNDPLICHEGLKAKWTAALFDAMQIIKQNIKKVKLPFLTLHGTKDKVVHIASSQFLMEQTPSKDKTMKVFEGCRHQLFHDKDQEIAKQVVLDWLNNHCSDCTIASVDSKL